MKEKKSNQKERNLNSENLTDKGYIGIQKKGYIQGLLKKILRVKK